MRSSHGAIEALLASGPPPIGGQANAAENRMLRVISLRGEFLPGTTIPRRDPVARHRCIRNHRLAEVTSPQHAVLRAAYDGEDWTRTLDERVGYGVRLELQRLFPHELLQVAPYAPTVQRALRPKKVAPAPTEPVYRDGREHLASIRVALSLPEAAPLPDIRARLRDIGTYFRKATLPPWGPGIAATIEALRAATGERGEARQVLLAARERLSEGLRLAASHELGVVVSQAKRPTPPTAQSYLLKLVAGGKKDTLAKIRKEAEALLSAAHAAAHVLVLPKGFKTKERKPRVGVSRSTPLSHVEVLSTEEASDALCA